MNFPYFLCKSLVKMSGQVKINEHNPLSSLHHSSLIKILICYELEQRKDTWIAFLDHNCLGFSNWPAEIVPKTNSSQVNDEEERLSNEDNRPLSDLLQKKMQHKLMQKQGGVKMVGTRLSTKQKKGRSKTRLQRSNRKQKKKQNKDVSTTHAIECFNAVIDSALEHSPIDGSLINKHKRKRRNVVFTSLKEEIQIENTSQNPPLVRRVTRIMVKRKFQIVQREMSPVLVEDSSPERQLDPQLDLCWNSEAKEAHKLYSPECMSPMQDPHKYPLEELVIPQYVQNEENISSPPSAET